MKTLVAFSLALNTLALSAQTIRCPKGDCGHFSVFVSAAEAAIKKPDFNAAIVQYNAARVCCPSAAGAIDTAILRVFEHIENQRKKSDANADRAKKAEDRANQFLKKANRLIEYFGFTQDRAWAYKNGKFAVIDRDGKQWTDFVFENPDTFQANGYALARKGGFDVLVDISGNTSPEYDYLFPTNKDGWYKAKKDKKYGFVDYRGQPLPGIDWYGRIDTFSNGLAAVRKGDSTGYINLKGEVVIAPRFFSASAFQGDVAWAALDYNQSGLIDRKGNFIIKPEYSEGRFIAPGFSQARKPGKWGVIGKKGEYFIKPEYDYIRETTDSLIAVRKDGKWGYVNLNANGQLLFQPRFTDVGTFYEGLATVWESDTVARYIKTDGTYAFPDSFALANDFSNGLAWVWVKKPGGNKWGCIGKDGAFKIKPMLDGRTGFAEGVAWAMMDEKWRLIDTNGRFLTAETDFDSVPQYYFYNKMAAAMKNGKWGFIGTDGKWAVEPQYQEVKYFSEDLAPVKLGDRWGFIGKDDKWVIPAQFQEVRGFSSDGLAAVKMGDKWGYIHPNGNLAIPPQFETIESFYKGLARVTKDAKTWGLIKKDGSFLVAPGAYDSWDGFSEGFMPVLKKDKWGFLDSTGTLIIEPQFKAARYFREGFAWVRTDTSEGFINPSGKFIFERPLNAEYVSDKDYYSRFRDFSDGMAEVEIDNKRGYIDKQGNLVVPTIFDATNPFSTGYALVMFGSGYEVLDNTGHLIAKMDDPIQSVTGHIARTVKWERNGSKQGFCNLSTGAVVPPMYDELYNFLDGAAWFINYGSDYKWGLMDENGQILIPPRYNHITGAQSDLTLLYDYEGHQLLVNRRGDTLLQKLYFNAVGPLSEGLAWIDVEGKRGYIDSLGKFVIPLRPTDYSGGGGDEIPYEYTRGFSGYRVYLGDDSYQSGNFPRKWLGARPGNFCNGLAVAFKGGKAGYIDISGGFKIEPLYDWATNFSEELAWVKKDKKWNLIDKNGHFVEGVQYDWGVPFSGGYAVVMASGKFGMIDRSAQLLLPTEYEAVVDFSEGMAAVRKNGKWGYVNQKGELVIRNQYESATDFAGGKALVTLDKSEEVFVINKKGQIIVDVSLEQQTAPPHEPNER